MDPPRFSDNPKYPPKKNLAKTPKTLPPSGFPTTVHLCNTPLSILYVGSIKGVGSEPVCVRANERERERESNRNECRDRQTERNIRDIQTYATQNILCFSKTCGISTTIFCKNNVFYLMMERYN